MTLAGHAAESGVDAVAVIGPPYFQYDEDAFFAHFAAAAAGAQTPFFLYEFERTSGYAIRSTSSSGCGRLRRTSPGSRSRMRPSSASGPT